MGEVETGFEVGAGGTERCGDFDADGQVQITRAAEVEIAARGLGQEIDLVAREDELAVWRHEAQFAGLVSPTR